MADKLTPELRSVNMSRIRSKGMKPEMTVRRLVHAMGHRYRLHRRDLPGNPDLVFPKFRLTLFVHGCFWHQHDDPECKISRLPKSNQEYWLPKLKRNVERDFANRKKLEALGWRVESLWECQTRDLDELKARIRSILEFS